MDIFKDDPLEFLDFTGVEESERERVLSSLHTTSSNLQLPWIITQNVPSVRSQKIHSQNDIKRKQNLPSHVRPVTHQNAPAPQNLYCYDQGQFQHVYNIPPKFPLPSVPYNVPYHPAVVPMPSVYTNFHHTPQGISSPVIYSPEPPYTYAQVSPAPASFENHPQFAHSPQYGTNASNTAASHHEQNGNASPAVAEVLPANVNNIPPQATFVQTVIVTSPNIVAPVVNPNPVNYPNINVNNDTLNPRQKVNPQEKPNHPTAIVSYGVPNSSPFPTYRENNSVVLDGPTVNKTDKNDDDQLCTKQNGTSSNGVNGAELHTAKASGGKSWASLFNKGASSVVLNNTDKTNGGSAQELKEEVDNKSCPIRNPRKAEFVDPTCYRMGEYLLNHVLDGRTISLQPRGLINRSNYCYINSILQALLACPPLYNLLNGLSKNVTTNEKRKPTPVIDNMCKLVKEFEHLPAGQRVGRRTDKNQKKEAVVSINCGNPFEPAWIYKMLNGMRSDSFLIEGRQEDAEEFFGCLVNGLNDEMQELIKLVDNNDSDEGTADIVPKADQDEDNWQVMGPKNKGSITRKTVFGKTPISEIFGGLLRSKIHRAGDESTNNIQPFFTLQLNIEKAKTVSEALEALSTKNQLEGVTSSKTNEQVEAWQQVLIEELPVVLVLHLKCFDYQLSGCTKVMKSLDFPIDLKIDAKLISSKTSSSKEKQYKLFAVVYHDGKEASKGHYLTDAFHVGYNSWLRYDDASVKAVSEEQVLSPQGCRVPYLLFYRRSDTIRSK